MLWAQKDISELMYWSTPKRFRLPSTGKAHHGRLHTWIFCQKRFEALNKRVMRIDAVEPVGNAAETWIEFVRRKMAVCYPVASHPLIRPWNHREMSIPKSCVMGTGVAHDGQRCKPTLKTFVLWNIETTGDLLLHGVVIHVLVEF